MNTGLGPGETTRCRRGAFRFRWEVTGCLPREVVVDVQPLEALPATGPAAVLPAVQRTSVTEVLVPDVADGLAFTVRPAGGGSFADGVRIAAQVVLQGGPFDGDQYVLRTADASGTTRIVLLEAALVDGGVELAVPDSVVAVVDGAGAPEGLVRRATYAARRCTGGSGRLRVDQRAELHLAVDRSASLLPFVRRGAAQALLEVLLGVNAVCGTGPEVPVWSLDRRQQRLPLPLRGDTVDGYWETALGSEPQTGGTVLAPLVQATAAAPAPRTVVAMSDGVPGDLESAVARIEQAREAGSTTRWHLLLFAKGPDDPEVRRQPWRDETGPLAGLARRGLLGLTCVSEGPGQPALRDRLAADLDLEQLVGSLAMQSGPA